MTGPATYAVDADVAAARESLDRAVGTVERMAEAQRLAVADLFELWPRSAWRAAGVCRRCRG